MKINLPNGVVLELESKEDKELAIRTLLNGAPGSARHDSEPSTPPEPDAVDPEKSESDEFEVLEPPPARRRRRRKHYVTQRESEVIELLRHVDRPLKTAELAKMDGISQTDICYHVARLIDGVSGRPPLVERVLGTRGYRLTALGNTAKYTIVSSPKSSYV